MEISDQAGVRSRLLAKKNALVQVFDVLSQGKLPDDSALNATPTTGWDEDTDPILDTLTELLAVEAALERLSQVGGVSCRRCGTPLGNRGLTPSIDAGLCPRCAARNQDL